MSRVRQSNEDNVAKIKAALQAEADKLKVEDTTELLHDLHRYLEWRREFRYRSTEMPWIQLQLFRAAVDKAIGEVFDKLFARLKAQNDPSGWSPEDVRALDLVLASDLDTDHRQRLSEVRAIRLRNARSAEDLDTIVLDAALVGYIKREEFRPFLKKVFERADALKMDRADFVAHLADNVVFRDGSYHRQYAELAPLIVQEGLEPLPPEKKDEAYFTLIETLREKGRNREHLGEDFYLIGSFYGPAERSHNEVAAQLSGAQRVRYQQRRSAAEGRWVRSSLLGLQAWCREVVADMRTGGGKKSPPNPHPLFDASVD